MVAWSYSCRSKQNFHVSPIINFEALETDHSAIRIGRITEGLLLSIAETVDIVEPIAKFSDLLKGKEGIGRIWNIGLEEWSFDGGDAHESTKYDLIWNQWCLGHLTDVQLTEYLKKCAKALSPGGWIVVKENLSTAGKDIFDDVDSSVTR